MEGSPGCTRAGLGLQTWGRAITGVLGRGERGQLSPLCLEDLRHPELSC